MTKMYRHTLDNLSLIDSTDRSILSVYTLLDYIMTLATHRYNIFNVKTVRLPCDLTWKKKDIIYVAVQY